MWFLNNSIYDNKTLIFFVEALFLHLHNVGLHFSQHSFSRAIPLNLAEALLL